MIEFLWFVVVILPLVYLGWYLGFNFLVTTDVLHHNPLDGKTKTFLRRLLNQEEHFNNNNEDETN